jgi:hypothetical protein
MHVFMMGDSVFDNAAYVRSGEPDVRKQVADFLAQGDQVTSAARDGAVIAGITEQLGRRPAEASHIVVSAGGNDALQAASVLETRVSSMADALEMLADVAEKFRRQYAALLEQLASTRLPVAVCTIYDPRFPDPRLRRTGATALSVLNDAITREAFARGFALIDLRLVCGTDEDFANPIEPSAIGGAKIARAIVDFANGVEQSTTVFASATRKEPAR